MTASTADWLARNGAGVPVIGARSRERSRLLSWSEIEDLPEPEWIVEGLLPQAGVAQVFGPSNEGKTFVTLDLAMRVANGLTDWHDLAIRRSGPVVYCLMEGLYDWRRRVDAWISANGGSADSLFTLPEEELNISDEESIRRLIADVVALELSVDPVMVVVDTQALATPGVNENDNSEMGRVLSLLKRASHKTSALWVTVHHTGHEGSRARGASAQRAALDAEIRVMDGEIAFTKVKYAQTPRSRAFSLVPSGRSVWAAPADLAGPDAGLTVKQRRVVELVSKIPGITRSLLYDELKGDKASCFRMIDELVERRLIEEQVSGRSRKYFPRDDTDPVEREVVF